MSIFFTADTHFGHAKIIGFCNRPFNDFKEMDDALISNWNKIIDWKDDVYHLGDFACGPDATDSYIANIRYRLNGNIHLIGGNHDRKRRGSVLEWSPRVANLPIVWKRDYHELQVGKKLFVLYHFPQWSWTEATKGSYHLFGHVHGKYPGNGRSMDVGVDTNNFTPVHIDDVVNRLSKIVVSQPI